MSFDNFLKSLETDGGKVLVILFMLIYLMSAVMLFVMTGHQLQEGTKEVVTGAVGSLLTLLYQNLRTGGGSNDKK